ETSAPHRQPRNYIQGHLRRRRRSADDLTHSATEGDTRRAMRPSLRAALALGGIVAVYVALYAPARHFDYVWADRDAIADSAVYDLPLAQQLRTTEHARMDPSLMALHGIELMHESYRPLLIWTHALDRRWLGRAAPGAMHVHSCIYGGLAILAAF